MQKTAPAKAAPAKKPAATTAAPAKKAGAAPAKAAPAKATTTAKAPAKTAGVAPKVEETKKEEPKVVVVAVDPSDTTKWDHIQLKGLMAKVDTLWDEKKYCLIQDLQGNAARFFQYSASLYDMESDLRKMKLDIMKPAEITEQMRA